MLKSLSSFHDLDDGRFEQVSSICLSLEGDVLSFLLLVVLCVDERSFELDETRVKRVVNDEDIRRFYIYLFIRSFFDYHLHFHERNKVSLEFVFRLDLSFCLNLAISERLAFVKFHEDHHLKTCYVDLILFVEVSKDVK